MQQQYIPRVTVGVNESDQSYNHLKGGLAMATLNTEGIKSKGTVIDHHKHLDHGTPCLASCRPTN